MANRQFVDLSAYQRLAAEPIQNPLDSAIQGFTQGVQLQQLPQKLQNDALNQQLQQAIALSKLKELQSGQIHAVGGSLVRINPITGQPEVIFKPSSTAGTQFVGFDSKGNPIGFDPGTSTLKTLALPQGAEISGPLAPKTVGPETFSTVDTAERGLVRVGNRSNAATPLTMGDEGLTKPTKPEAGVKVKQFTDANGLLYTQPVTGGEITPVLNADGTPFNAGVANATFTSDQGVFTVPKKSVGAPTPTPLTIPGPTEAGGTVPAPRIQLTKTSGKSKGEENQAATKQFLSDLSDSAINTIETLEPQISRATVGIGSTTAFIPESPAADFAANVKSLTSDIRLGVLAQMKAASKTGASGLGQLSNQEGKSLEAALGSLETSQSPDQFRKNLAKVKEPIRKWKEGVQKFGAPSTGGEIVPRGTEAPAPIQIKSITQVQ